MWKEELANLRDLSQMNQSQGRTIRYAVAAVGALAILLFIGWLALREPPPPPPDIPPVRAITVSPHVPMPAPGNAALHGTPSDPLAQSAVIPTNAATIYQQAFALYDALSKEDKDLISYWQTNVDASVEAELCGKIQPICDLMQQATTATNCDWGVERLKYGSIMPYLDPSRHLARAAVWSATHCRTNNASVAVDDLLASSRLGQNVEIPPSVIGYLVNMSIQERVIKSAAMQASTLARDPRLVQLFNDANYYAEFRRGLDQEAEISDQTADAIAAMTTEEMMQLLNKALGGSSTNPLPTMDQAQTIAYLRQIAELQRQYAQTLELPEADYNKWLAGQTAFRQTNPFANIFFSTMGENMTKTQLFTVYNAMAAAGLAVVREGMGALQLYTDPSTGLPFTYRQTADGYELESSFPFRGKPLKLSFK